ncbi:TIGR03862 family flavoprotein [Yoonia sp. 208BN28-4]|uniref:TIGR03862 family flavoprotein n=1 Tax=Yoonia sp. 208BN28-4 TaxID=3126505 RepID=UPI0030B07741
MTDALVIGAGPAGLMAAEMLGRAGLQVTVADAMPSVGRKFLMAGKSGLNLTMSVPNDAFSKAYSDLPDQLAQAIAAFGPRDVQAWATDLGQDIFTGSSGRVFPKAMKASPLLRAWLAQLADQNVILRTRWRWTGWDNGATTFDTPDGPVSLSPKVTVLALGGASWSRLGSDGLWVRHFDGVADFKPANVGFAVDWSKYMIPFAGQAVKGVRLMAGDLSSRGEFIVSSRGVEGGGIYSVSAAVREGALLAIDLMPDVALDKLIARIAARRMKTSLSSFLKSSLKLSPIKGALFQECGRDAIGQTPEQIAGRLKSLPIATTGPFAMDEAISTAGGLRFADFDDNFMLKDRPGVFCAGEMLDWEAPTGGYLITACLATGRLAGLAAARYATA